MTISVETVKELRARTGAGIVECKTALEKAGGDMEKACESLKQRGFAIAEKKADRATTKGAIEVYVHTGKRVGAMVELLCETDFVARTDQFQQLGHDIAMQVAAMSPTYVSTEDMPKDSDADPAAVCLLNQPFIKDCSKSIEQLVKETISTLRENIKVRRFSRFEVGC